MIRANIATIATGHTLDEICFLLGEFSSLTAQVKTNFPVVTGLFHDGPVTRDSPDSISIQGELESGAAVTFHMFSTTFTTNASFAWTITGDKRSLKFEGNLVNIQMEPPTLYWQKGRELTKAIPEGVPMAEVVRNVGKGQGTYRRSLRSITPWPTARLGKCMKPMPRGKTSREASSTSKALH
jgi:predicted dehydrogenase